MWAQPNQNTKVKPSETQFIEYTLSKFMKELKASDEIQEVFSEYELYFGESK